MIKINKIFVGEGSYGVVYKSFCEKRGKEIVFKNCKNDNTKTIDASVIAEICILNLVKGNNIYVQMLDYDLRNDVSIIQLEIMDGSLKDILSDDKICRPSYEKRIEKFPTFVKTISSALSYLHDIGLYHNDIKPQNILVSNDFEIFKLCDFGLSGDKKRVITQGFISGEIQQKAPELFSDKLILDNYKSYDLRFSEAWSFGITCFYFLNRYNLFMIEESDNYLSTIIDEILFRNG